MRALPSFFFAALVVLALPACSSGDFAVAGGDGGTDSSGADATSDAPACTGSGCPCAAPLFRCGSTCVDRSTDPNHCGSCIEKCPEPPTGRATCAGGVCGVSCGSGSHACAGTCSPNDSPLSCGTSCKPCTAGPNGSPVCVSGACAIDCFAGFMDCDGKLGDGCETDIRTTAHCGSCTTACAGSDVCTPAGTGYACSATCTPPAVPCGTGTCADLTSDPSNCGKCGTACASVDHGRPTCKLSTCGFRCDTGYHKCGGHCAADDDKTMCGTSCTACVDPPNATGYCDAASGSCKFKCLSGFADCNGKADDGCEVNVTSDPLHCGGCGDACPATAPEIATCSGGTCGIKCETGWLPLGGRCAVMAGAFETGSAGPSVSCVTPNPLSPDPMTACTSCPAGFEALAIDVSNNVGGPTATLTICEVPAATGLPSGTTPPDWMGAFVVADGCGGSTGGAPPCDVKNPFTGGCTCPPGATELKMTLKYRASCGLNGGTLHLCQGSSHVEFWGAFEQTIDGTCVTAPCDCGSWGSSPTKYPVQVSNMSGFVLMCLR